VGLLLRTQRDDVERGQVLAHKALLNLTPIHAEIYVYQKKKVVVIRHFLMAIARSSILERRRNRCSYLPEALNVMPVITYL